MNPRSFMRQGSTYLLIRYLGPRDGAETGRLWKESEIGQVGSATGKSEGDG